MGLGIKAAGDSFRIHLNIQGAAPTGTPQILIEGPLRLIDLATDGAGTGVSSVVGGFEAGMVNAKLHIYDGVGFTVGDYSITVYTDTNNITIGSSAGVSKTGGSGVINNATILSATNMVQGASTHTWYYDYRVATDAVEGPYRVIRSAVISGTTYYAEEDFAVSAEVKAKSVGEEEDDESYW